jgi:multisubunit Na+/H+ antiporter MnhF subunit
MISALVFLILKSNNKAERIVAIDANEIVVVGVLL